MDNYPKEDIDLMISPTNSLALETSNFTLPYNIANIYQLKNISKLQPDNIILKTSN